MRGTPLGLSLLVGGERMWYTLAELASVHMQVATEVKVERD